METTKTTKKTTKASASKTDGASSKVSKVKTPVSMEAKIYSISGNKTETMTLPENMFGLKWNADLVHQVVVGMQANGRSLVAHTKNRGEVSGGGKKPWKQKGTGRARHGSNRSPIWKGGGITHGPRVDKIYAVKINKKMRVAALMTVLSRKWRDGEIIFVDSFSFSTPKTKDAVTALARIATESGEKMLTTKRKNAAIIAFARKDVAGGKSFKNLQSMLVQEVRNLNPLDIVTNKYLVIEKPKESISILSERLSQKTTTTA
jgi:large subunit ribosomal protein L4